LYRIQLISNTARFQKKACIDIHWFNIIDKKIAVTRLHDILLRYWLYV